jgi:hypothetical protein
MLTPENAQERIADLLTTSEEDDINKLGFDDLKLRPDQCRFINRIVERHGGGILFRSKKQQNIELQVADPVLLEQDGDKELLSRHLYINIDKVTNEQHNRAACCIKDGRVYDVRELLQMLPIEDRSLNIPKSKVKRRVSVIDRLQFMRRDDAGNLVPQGPGECTPVDALDADHPAAQYLLSRGFNLTVLVKQFGTAWCHTENPNLPYKSLPGEFSATPQGRIVFFIHQLGVERGWQARRLERYKGNELQFWHPYHEQWETVAVKGTNGLSVLPRYSGQTIGKAPGVILKQKYVIGIGVEKSQTLMGFDAAREWCKTNNKKTVGIVEGVLDAARLGPPFCSIMGLQLSTNQSALVANHFDRVIYTSDNDVNTYDDGRKDNATLFCESVESVLRSKNIELVKAPPPPDAEAAGDMSVEQVKTFKEKYNL